MMHHLEMFCYWLKEKSTFCESALGRIWMFCGCRSTDSILCVSAGGRIDALKGRRFVGESLRSLKKSFVRKVRHPHSLPSLSLSLSSKGIRLNAAAAAFTHCPSCGGAINYCMYICSAVAPIKWPPVFSVRGGEGGGAPPPAIHIYAAVCVCV